jgi:hypothetical protein
MSKIRELGIDLQQTVEDFPVAELTTAADRLQKAAGLLGWVAQQAGGDISPAGINTAATDAVHTYLTAIGLPDFAQGDASTEKGAPGTVRSSAIQEPEDMSREQSPTPSLLDEQTKRTKEDMLEDHQRWESGKRTPSRADAIAELQITDEERRVLTGINFNEFRQVNAGEIDDPHTTSPTIRSLTEAQRRVITSIRDRFRTIVERDGERGGMGPIDNGTFIAEIGRFDPSIAGLDWHVDVGGGPAVRYVMSFGPSGSTRFGTGHTTRTDTAPSTGYLIRSEEKAAQLDITTHGEGVVSRFQTNLTVHATPSKPGWRLFLSCDVPLY